MKSVKFTVNGQQLRRITTPYLVRDSKNYIQLDFAFSSDWAECEKKAIFNGKYEESITENSIIVPVSCLTVSEFTISVYGVIGDEVLITTNEVVIGLNQSGYVADAEPTPETQIAELETKNATLESRVEELEIEAEQKETNLLIALGNGVIE